MCFFTETQQEPATEGRIILQHAHLSDHAVPLAVNVLAMSPVGDQVEVIGEAYDLGQPLQDVDAEPFAAVLHGHGALHHQTDART